jgi:acetate kinase
LHLIIFCYRVGLTAGMLAAALGGIDAFVFTAGIGENSAAIRANSHQTPLVGCGSGCKDQFGPCPLISVPESRVALYIIPTDEELMIARHTLAALSAEIL